MKLVRHVTKAWRRNAEAWEYEANGKSAVISFWFMTNRFAVYRGTIDHIMGDGAYADGLLSAQLLVMQLLGAEQ